MRVVVAGSSGLIGTQLIAALRREGHEVLRLVRRTAAAPDERHWDPPSGRIEDGALDGADAVVNLCGAPMAPRRWSAARKQLLTDSRIEPTEVLAAAVAEQRIPVLVNSSAVGYYGDTGPRAVDESAPAGAGFLAGLCRQWEDATAPASAAGARVVLLRTGPVLSRSGGLLGPLRPLFALALGGRLGDGSQYMSWIHQVDAIDAIVFSLGADTVRGPVNLTAPNPVTNAEFTRAFGRSLGRPAPWLVPGFALRFALGELAEEALLTGQRAVPGVLVDSGFRHAYPDIGGALGSVADR